MADIVVRDTRESRLPCAVRICDFPGLVVIDRANNIIPGAIMAYPNGAVDVALTAGLSVPVDARNVRLAYSDGVRLFSVNMRSIVVLRPTDAICLLPPAPAPDPVQTQDFADDVVPDAVAYHDSVRAILCDNMNIAAERFEEIFKATQARLTEDFGFDSLDNVGFVLKLESAFGIEIPDDAAEPCKTFADVVALVTKKAEALPKK